MFRKQFVQFRSEIPHVKLYFISIEQRLTLVYFITEGSKKETVKL